jgi:hypothetical protein
MAPLKKGWCTEEDREAGCWVFWNSVILQASQQERAAKEKEERQFGK